MSEGMKTVCAGCFLIDLPEKFEYLLDRAVRDPLVADQEERVMLFVGLPGHPDLTTVLHMMTGTKSGKDGLLSRVEKHGASQSLEARARMTVLNAEKRVINGISGEQVLRRYYEGKFTTGFSFWWESNCMEDDMSTPFLSLQLQTGINSSVGKPMWPGLPEAVLRDLWDKISSSIRVQPIDQPKVSTKRVALPVGACAWAGDICPQSGWWQCNEGGNAAGVLGGQRQYIKQGERMPQALLLLPQTAWQKARGLQSSFEAKAPTMWKLVDKCGRERVASGAPLAGAAASSSLKAAEQRCPIGSVASTGTPCPASGWWHCEESHALDGTRWFAQGSLLPAATLSVSTDFFVKSADGPKVIQRPGAWRLVRLAPAPERAKSGNWPAAPEAGDGNPVDPDASHFAT